QGISGYFECRVRRKQFQQSGALACRVNFRLRSGSYSIGKVYRVRLRSPVRMSAPYAKQTSPAWSARRRCARRDGPSSARCPVRRGNVRPVGAKAELVAQRRLDAIAIEDFAFDLRGLHCLFADEIDPQASWSSQCGEQLQTPGPTPQVTKKRAADFSAASRESQNAR